nr:cytochrome P450 3A19-like [Leptinotarsa decemlineata]
MMIPKIISVSDSLIQNIEKYTDIKADINIKQIASEFTVNSIASCILGIIPGTPEKLGNCFAEVTRKHFERERLSYLLRVSFLNRFPDLSCKLGLRYIKKEVAEFFLKLVEDCISYRKENKFICSDFLQSLINLRNKKNAKVNILTDEFLAAQVFSLFSASLETSSTVITFTLYELATNTHIQERLRKEINEVLEKHKGQLNDVALNEMIYLRQVINESLRLYPPITSLERRCMKNYKIDGTDLMIEKHISITIPIFGLHRDSRNYPYPEKFDPDRFSAENKHNIQPHTYLPFGIGPRSCIGQRIGFLLIQIALVEILKKLKLIVSASTRLPFEMDKVNLFLTIKNPVFLKAEKIQH